jgi:small subunit ribosomal protein S16
VGFPAFETRSLARTSLLDPAKPSKKSIKKFEGVSLPMVRIRLRRMGLKAQPSYRLVVTDKENPRDGRFLEIVGFYNPRTNPTTLSLEEARIYDWMAKGAQPTESVAQLFKSAGLDDRFTRFKKGEPVEALVEEATKTMGGKFTPVEQGAKTRRD